jgi:hypothetical protein
MPNKTTILALASAAAALATAASALAEDCGGEAAPETAAPAAGGEVAPKRGRPAAAAKAATGKTLDELKEIIAPLVKGAPGFPGAGAKIKAIIKDLGVEALKDLPADKQEDFLAAIKPLQEELEAASI